MNFFVISKVSSDIEKLFVAANFVQTVYFSLASEQQRSSTHIRLSRCSLMSTLTGGSSIQRYDTSLFVASV